MADPLPEALRPFTLYSSLRGLASAVIAPTALIALGGAASRNGFRWLPALLLGLGIVLALGVLLDFPRHTRFDTTGMTRVCPLRRQHLSWDDTVAIERAPASTADRIRALREREPVPLPSGGLVARGTGRRRWLLTDRSESPLEFAAVEAMLRARAGATVLRAGRPRDGTAPTFLYRPRRSAAPDGGVSRPVTARPGARRARLRAPRHPRPPQQP